MSKAILTALALMVLTSTTAAEPAQLTTTTADQPWVIEPAPGWQEGAEATEPAVTLLADQLKQTIHGFGGCFNEKGWEVLNLLSEEKREAVLLRLFDAEKGCAFNIGRMPMGANDYSLEWYSFDETPDDYELKDFSIERDREHLVPYIHAARSINPELSVWASPWSPPSWMKTNGHYACAPAEVNDLKPEQAGEEMVTQFRMEPRVLSSYASYFTRFLDAYAEEGIEIQAVHVQNEPNSCQNFPSCVWRPEDLATFIGGYLGPLFEEQGRKTQIWLGTIERPQIERIDPILQDPDAAKYVHGVGFQWAGKDAIPEVHRKYPELPLVQTETECGNGSNDWAAAVHTWGLIKHYFAHGANAYMYWNMVLDETGNSRWGWRQNAMITVDRETRAVRYNLEYYLMKHLAHFVRPGAHKIATSGAADDVLAFVNPDGGTVLFLANLEQEPRSVQVESAGRYLTVTLPAESFSTLTF